MVWFDVIVLTLTINEAVYQSWTSSLPIKYQKRKHFHSYAWLLMTGDEREEGTTDVPAGRETTNPPDNRMEKFVELIKQLKFVSINSVSLSVTGRLTNRQID